MNDLNDRELLQKFNKNGDEAAFLQLVDRHLNLVYSCALRRLNNVHAAQDVSQSVFCLLARKASRLAGTAGLTGWLHRATCLKCLEFLRSERRRRYYEQAAALMNDHSSQTTPDAWAELAPHLDEAVNRLNETDRRAILLRYFRGLSLREVGDALGIAEDAARMRIGRALQRLRGQLVKSIPALAGVTALSELLESNALGAVPPGLDSSVAGAALEANLTKAGIMSSVWLANLTCLLFSVRMGLVALMLLTAMNLGLWSFNRSQGRRVAPEASAAEVAPPARGTRDEAFQRVLSRLKAAPLPAEDVTALLERLQSILHSTVVDGVWPPEDLRQCIRALSSQPHLVFETLITVLRDPASGSAARERAIWGFWLLGKETPAMIVEIMPVLLEVLRSPAERLLWGHAADVIRHLGPPEGAAIAVSTVLTANPAAAYSTLHFWEGAGNAVEVSELIRPWLLMEDPLRFCAAYVLALVPGENAAQLVPILAEGLQRNEQQDRALRALQNLGPAASELAPSLRDLLDDAERRGMTWLARRLVEVLASVAPDLRSELPGVDQFLATKEAVDTLRNKLETETVSMADLITGLKNPKTSWMAANVLEEMGPWADEALPALRDALFDPENDSKRHLADAIKAIDPESPKPLFDRDELMATLRALSETISELASELDSGVRDAVTDFIDTTRYFTPEQLADQARNLEAIHPKLQQTYIAELMKVDPALQTVLSNLSSFAQ